MSMLISKSKIKEDNMRIYQIIMKDVKLEANAIQQVIFDRGIYREAITVIYSLLINLSAPLNYKINALDLLKLIFQTAQQKAINQTARVLGVLVDITVDQSQKNPHDSLSNLYLKPQTMSKQQKFALYAKQILKQWSQYMEDCNGSNSEYIAAFEKAQRKGVHFPEYFTFFSMRDYIQFMLNWMRFNRTEMHFADKVQIYRFLTNQEVYRDKLPKYRVALHQYAELLVYETYSLLINHSIPIRCKFVALQSLKDLYQEGNHIYCHRADQLIVPYFEYIVRSIEKDPALLKRFLEKIEKRYEIQANSSANYVSTILQLIKQWSLYQQDSSQNPFKALVSIIERNKMLAQNTASLFKSSDIHKFQQNRILGRHRRKQYQIPPDPIEAQNAQLAKLKVLVYELQRNKRQDEQTIRALQIQLSSYDKTFANKVVNLRQQASQTQSGAIQSVPLTNSYIETPILHSNRTSNSASKKVLLKEKQSSLIKQVQARINNIVGEKIKSEKKQDRPEHFRMSTPQIKEFPKPIRRSLVVRQSNTNPDTMKMSDLIQIQNNRMSLKREL